MTHWEYGWLTLSPDADKEWIFKKFDGSAIPNIFEYNSVEFALYDLGKKSWELVSQSMMGKVGLAKNLFSKENMPHIKQNLVNFFVNWMLRIDILSHDVSKGPPLKREDVVTFPI